MEKTEVIKSIGKRSGGDIYLGVVGAVRTGKSTFIRKFMENLIIPNITDEYERKRCLDELPQAAAGKTIIRKRPNRCGRLPKLPCIFYANRQQPHTRYVCYFWQAICRLG